MEELYNEICKGISKIRRYSADAIEKIVKYNDAKLEFKIIADENYNYCDAVFIRKKVKDNKYIHIIDDGIGIMIRLYMQTESCLNKLNEPVKCIVKHVEIGNYFISY